MYYTIDDSYNNFLGVGLGTRITITSIFINSLKLAVMLLYVKCQIHSFMYYTTYSNTTIF